MIRADDALKYGAALVKKYTDVALDAIAGSEDCDGHDTALNLINDAVDEVQRLAAQFGDLNRYSDGRAVRSCTEIEFGCYTEHIWQPDASAERPWSWRGNLMSDPEVPSPGIFEVSTDPATQHVHVRVVRLT